MYPKCKVSLSDMSNVTQQYADDTRLYISVYSNSPTLFKGLTVIRFPSKCITILKQIL